MMQESWNGRGTLDETDRSKGLLSDTKKQSRIQSVLGVT